MDRRIWIALAVAGVAVAAWRFWPEADSPDPRGDRTAAASPAPGAASAAAARASSDTGPHRPPPPVRMQARSHTPAGPAAGLAVVFEAEARNPEWADPREEEVAARAARALAAAGTPAASLGQVECRSRSCRLSIASDQPAAVARAIERLGEEGGFYRFAEQMTVEAVDQAEGGPRRVNVYLRFGR